ncbi:major facilitator superfamily domain-containing protein [Mycena rebaudengoi]|nr:major facilitator superfamily domain-containing protein [Mycena rebaudengoi]
MHPHSEPRTITESSPLLADHSSLEAQKRPTPLPKAQLAALCVSRLTDPVAYSQIFPYINEFLILLHVADVSKVGFYSGLVESTFAIAQTLTSYHWAKLSDIIGRRPIILTGALGLAVVTLLLGFCSSLTQILIVRALAGCLAGNLAVYHSILAEITDSSNQAVAYPLYSFTWPFGATIGPLLGGLFSNLGTKYPRYFGYDFILAYPYFMPGFVCSLLVMVGFSLSYWYLEETLPSKRRRPTLSDDGALDHVIPPPPSVGAMDLLAIPMMRAVVAVSIRIRIHRNRLRRRTRAVLLHPRCERRAVILGKSASGPNTPTKVTSVPQLLMMPTLLRKYNAANLYHFSMKSWPLTFILIPFLNVVVRNGSYDEQTGLRDYTTNIILWIGIAVVLLCSRIGALAFATNMIVVRKHAPSPASLGATNGLGPGRHGNNLLGGYPIWVVLMFSISLLGCMLSHRMLAIDQKVLK